MKEKKIQKLELDGVPAVFKANPKSYRDWLAGWKAAIRHVAGEKRK